MARVYQPEGFFVTTLSSDINASTATIPLTAVPSRYTLGYMVIEPSSATKREVIHFTSVGVSTVTAADDTTDASDATGRGCLGSVTVGANTTHSQGATVIIAATEQYWDRLFDAIGTIIDTTTGVPDLNGNELIIDADADTSMTADTDDQIDFKLGGSDRFRMKTADLDLVTTTANITLNGADPYKTITLTPGFLKPTTTAPCASSATAEAGTNDIDYDYLAFDKDTDENAFANLTMPGNWDGGVVQFRTIWTNASGGSASETFVLEMSGRSYADDDAIDQAVGTAVEVSDALIAAGDVHISAWSGDVTITGAGPGEWTHFEFMRDTSEDNLAGDALLLGVQIRYKESQLNHW